MDAGPWAQVPPGLPHTLSFPGSEPVRLLYVHTPNRGFGAFVRALHHAEDEQLAAARAEFDQQLARGLASRRFRASFDPGRGV